MTTIVRAQVAHAARNPFAEEAALEAFFEGAMAVSNGRIVALGSWSNVRSGHTEAEVWTRGTHFCCPDSPIATSTCTTSG
jgi:guanine deaminase